MITLHVGLAERGKQLALRNNHVEALRYYREAMRHATSQGAPEVFLRYYTQCALESLDHLGAWDEILATCERAKTHYRAHPPSDDIARKDHGSFLERAGVVLLKLDRRIEAAQSFSEAIEASKPCRVPLAETLLRWIRSNLHVTADRLNRELSRQRFWSVRADNLRPDLAIDLPGPELSP